MLDRASPEVHTIPGDFEYTNLINYLQMQLDLGVQNNISSPQSLYSLSPVSSISFLLAPPY